jgi:acyl-CoA thioester hydrolase
MEKFNKQVQLRWSDMDPNFHIRHSVYYDWGAMCRIDFLTNYGLTPTVMQQHFFGPIIFREECVFRKEIKFGDEIIITAAVTKARRDYSRWTFQHHIYKNSDTLCAILTIDGAWIDTKLRKLYMPAEEITKVYDQLPRSEDFVWTD